MSDIPTCVIRYTHNRDGGWKNYLCPSVPEAWRLMNRLIEHRIGEGSTVEQLTVKDSLGNDIAQVHIDRVAVCMPRETYWLHVETNDQQ